MRSILSVVVIDVRIPQRSPGHQVTANADGHDLSELIEDIVELSFGDVGLEVTDVEGGGDERARRVREDGDLLGLDQMSHDSDFFGRFGRRESGGGRDEEDEDNSFWFFRFWGALRLWRRRLETANGEEEKEEEIDRQTDKTTEKEEGKGFGGGSLPCDSACC